jgi:hypothetical protein
MATVQLSRREAEDDDLPDVCMKCGAPATTRISRAFAWYPEWVWITILAGLLIFVILALVLTKRMRVEVPLCDEHKKHWFNRNLAIWGTFGILALLMVIGIGIAVAAADPSDRDGNPVFGVICIGSLVCLIPWLTVVAIAHYSMIRPSEITDRSIRLTKVSDEFVDAVEDYRYERRRARDDDNEDYRRKFRPRRREESEDVYDPEPPRRRRSPPDAYEEER